MTKKKKSWKETTGLREEMQINKLLKESEKHDRATCDCEGCYWWNITRTISKSGRVFFVINSWKDMDRDEYLRIMQRELNYRIYKSKDRKALVAFLMKQKMPKKQAEKVADQMMAPIFMVMVGSAPSPHGLLRDI